jgi:hypothetical protein
MAEDGRRDEHVTSLCCAGKCKLTLTLFWDDSCCAYPFAYVFFCEHLFLFGVPPHAHQVNGIKTQENGKALSFLLLGRILGILK